MTRAPAVVHEDAGREHGGRLEQVVTLEAEPSRGEADPSAECQPRDTDGRTGSRRDGAPALRERGVHVDQARTGAERGAVVERERDGVDTGDVDDDAGGGRVTPVAVTARSRDDPNSVLACPADGALHVGGRFAERDRGRLDRVEAGVVEHARGVVAGFAALDDVTAQRPVELAEDAGRRCGSRERIGQGNRGEGERSTSWDELPARATFPDLD